MLLFNTLIALLLLDEPIDSARAATDYCEAYTNVTLPKTGYVSNSKHGQYECLEMLFGWGDRKRDPRNAVGCCLTDGRCPVYAAMAFANGWGVKRNLGAAAHLVCRAEKEVAPAEWWSMLDHIARMQRGEERKKLDFCEHVTSGRGASWCARLEWYRIAPDLEKRLERAGRGLTPEALEALNALRTRSETFLHDEQERVADDSRGGSLYSSYFVSAGTEQAQTFVDLVERYAKRRALRSSPAQWKTAQEALNAALERRLPEYSDCAECIEHIHAAHRSWIEFRDAVADFYVARYRDAEEAEALRLEILTELSLERAAVLSRR